MRNMDVELLLGMIRESDRPSSRPGFGSGAGEDARATAGREAGATKTWLRDFAEEEIDELD